MDGVLIQCASLICRSLLAFLLSVWSMASISTSLVVCWLFLKWYVDSHEVLFHICFHLVVCVDCLVFGRDTVCGIFCR